MKKLIKVVGAIIENDFNQILCARRSATMSMPNLWEFPGGKIENGESLRQAIEREILEELCCKVQFKCIFHDNTYEYDSFIVHLVTVKCTIISGTPTATEHSELLWLKRENLQSLKWAPADVQAVELLCKEKV